MKLKKLVVQRISLLMFKRHIGITPLPIINIFIVNNAQHAYYTRQINSLHTQIGNNEKVYKMFNFHGINIWNHMFRKISIDVHIHATKISKRYIQWNTITYRIT